MDFTLESDVSKGVLAPIESAAPTLPSVEEFSSTSQTERCRLSAISNDVVLGLSPRRGSFHRTRLEDEAAEGRGQPESSAAVNVFFPCISFCYLLLT